MRTILRLALAAVVAVGLGTTARAEDWSGFYIGGLAGFTIGTDVDDGGTVQLPGVAKVVGYNWDDGDVVYGIEEMVVFSFWPYDFGDPTKISWQKMFRVGTEIADDVLVYGGIGAGASFLWESGEFDGFLPYLAVAAGVEAVLSENVNWRTHVQFSRSAPYAPCADCFVRAISVGTGLIWDFN